MKVIFSILVAFSLFLCPAANADEISHRAAAEELLLLMKTDQMVKPLFEQMNSMMEQQFKIMGVPEKERPKLKKYTDKFLKVLEDQLSWEKIKKDYIEIYTETFAEDELRAISAFYKTPAGQTFIQKMPLLIKKSSEITQKIMPEITKKMQQITVEMAEEIKAEVEKKPMPTNNKKTAK
jgi:hypothetical protein